MNLLTGVQNKNLLPRLLQENFPAYFHEDALRGKIYVSTSPESCFVRLANIFLIASASTLFYYTWASNPFRLTATELLLLAKKLSVAVFRANTAIVNNTKPLEGCLRKLWRLPSLSSTIEARIISALLENFLEQRQSRCKQKKFPSPGELPVACVLYQRKTFSDLHKNPEDVSELFHLNLIPASSVFEENKIIHTCPWAYTSLTVMHTGSNEAALWEWPEKKKHQQRKGKWIFHDQTFKSIQFLCRDFEGLLSRLSLSETFLSSLHPHCHLSRCRNAIIIHSQTKRIAMSLQRSENFRN